MLSNDTCAGEPLLTLKVYWCLDQLLSTQANNKWRGFLLGVQVFVDGALHQDATFMRCDLNHTATCC